MFRPLTSRFSTSRSTVNPQTFAPQSFTPRTGLIKISVAGLLWGTTGVVVQVLHQATALTAVSIGFYRLAIAAVALLAVRRPRAVLAALRASPLGPVLAGVGLGTYQALYFVAVTLGGVSIATVVGLGLAPVLLAGWETVRARRLPDRTTSVTLVAGVLGLTLITVSTGPPAEGAPHPLLGLLAAVGCGIVYAASTLVSQTEAQRIDALTLTTLSTGIGAVALAPLAVLGGFAGVAVPLRAGPLLLLGYLGIVTTAVAYGLFYAGLRTTAGSTAAVLTLLEPLAAALLALLLLRESLPLPAWLGGGLMLVAIVVRYLSPAPPNPRRTDSERDSEPGSKSDSETNPGRAKTGLR